MKTIWRHWKSGWLVLVRMIPFFIIVWIVCLPVMAFDYFLRARDVAIFTDEGFHWQPAASFLLMVILFPIALSAAQKLTGHFSEQTPHPETTSTKKPNQTVERTDAPPLSSESQ